MPPKTWTLTDREQGVYVDEIKLGPDQLGGANCSVVKRTLRGGLSDGVDVVEVDNGAVRFTILPTRGMGVWKAWLGEIEFGWRSPVKGPVHPNYVPVHEASGLGWLEGFDELLCRCGLASNGAPEFAADGALAYPLHGRIANLPAHKLDVSVDDAGEIRVTGVVDESRFHFQKLRLTATFATRPGERGFRVLDEVTNLAATPGEMELLYHINFGRPLLEPGARTAAPFKTLVPRNDRAAEDVDAWHTYGAPQADYAEQVYFMDLASGDDGETRALLKNAHGTLGASLGYDVRQLPCFTLWKNTVADVDGYVTGLEPGINFPNPRSHEADQGRVAPLAPGESRRFEIGVHLHGDAGEVARAEQEIARLASGVEPVLHRTPRPGWTIG